jgi:hypothetical protein
MPFPIILCGCADLLYGYLRELLGPHDNSCGICRHSLQLITLQACWHLVYDTAVSAIARVTEFAMKTKGRVRALLDGVPTIVTLSRFKF